MSPQARLFSPGHKILNFLMEPRLCCLPLMFLHQRELPRVFQGWMEPKKPLSFHFLTKPLRRAHCLAPPRAHFPGFGVVCRFHFPLCGSFVLPGRGGFKSLVLHQSDPRARPLGVFSPSNPGILAHGKVGVPTGLWAPCGMSFAAPALPEALQPSAFPAFSALRTRPIPIPAQLQNQRLP